MRSTRWLVVATALTLATSCLGQGITAPRLRGEGRRVLFVGNSYLYHQDIPGIVQAMATASGDAIAVATVAGPDLALIDHWNIGTAAREVAKGGWEWVVLQQGPSSTELNRDTLRLAVQRFAERIRAVDALPALFSAWPAVGRRVDFPRAIESYQLAAADVDGLFLPVASGWVAAWERQASLELYADGLHPSLSGAYLSAAVVYSCLLRKSPVGLPSALQILGGGGVTIAPAEATLLQEAASQVAAEHCGVAQPAIRK